jgi:16S rRNA (adenine1518-N6/adenine1519-N6)-dimethyltransferase
MPDQAGVNATEVREVLAGAGVLPSRKLGQNFLIDANVAAWIVAQLELQPDDTIVEVGPGTGALSEHLAGKVKRLVLIEYDSRLADYLRDRFAGVAGVEVHHADGAQFDTRVLFGAQPVKMLGNLPYSAGGAILRNFLRQPTPICLAVLMLQKEFIDRIVARPRTKEYGVLTLRMQSEWDSRPVKTVPPEAFHPRPQIDSTVMVVRPRERDLPVFDARLFDELIRRGFAQRRKQLHKQMPEEPGWQEVAAAAGVSPSARAEELSLEDWVALTRAYDPHPLKDTAQSSAEEFDVVNEADEVIGRAPRGEVHAKGLMHRAVHVLVFNRRRELFLQKRSRLKDVHPGTWDSSAAGHLEPGEAYAAAAQRELAEELGIEEAELQQAGKLSPTAELGWEHVELFLALYDGAVRYPCSEVETGEWFPLDVVRSWIGARPRDFAPGFIACWTLFEERLADSAAADS